MLLKLVTLCAVFTTVFSIEGIRKEDMLPYGTAAGDTTINQHNRFQQSELLDFYTTLTIPTALPAFKIFGITLERNLYISYNGHVTFGDFWTEFDPYTVNTTKATISAIFNVYYSDNDVRRPDGLIFYRLSQNPVDLNIANGIIRAQGFTNFAASYCLIATWDKIKYYVKAGEHRNDTRYQQANTYQQVMCTDGNDGHVIYHYNEMQWTKSEDPLTNPATIGWVVKAAPAGSVGRFWAPPPSGKSDTFSRMALESNVGIKGRWMRSQEIVGPCVGAANGMYQINCTHYRECCGQRVQLENACPSGTTFHPTLKICVENALYTCNTSHFCNGRTDGNYAYTATGRSDLFYRCMSQVGRILTCPFGIPFGSVRCR